MLMAYPFSGLGKPLKGRALRYSPRYAAGCRCDRLRAGAFKLDHPL